MDNYDTSMLKFTVNPRIKLEIGTFETLNEVSINIFGFQK